MNDKELRDVAEWAGIDVYIFTGDSLQGLIRHVKTAQELKKDLTSPEGMKGIMEALAKDGLTIKISLGDSLTPSNYIIYLQWYGKAGPIIDADAPDLPTAVLEAGLAYLRSKK